MGILNKLHEVSDVVFSWTLPSLAVLSNGSLQIGGEVQKLLGILQQQMADSSDPFAAASLSFAAADQASMLDHVSHESCTQPLLLVACD